MTPQWMMMSHPDPSAEEWSITFTGKTQTAGKSLCFLLQLLVNHRHVLLSALAEVREIPI